MIEKSKIKILLVEDAKIAQMITKLLFEQMHYDVTIAETGKEAINLADKNLYHYIFMDLGLPDIDGVTASSRIKFNSRKNQNTPIFALTANSEKAIRKKCLDAGMNCILQKPITKEKCEELFRTS